jgi:hypothetical protein
MTTGLLGLEDLLDVGQHLQAQRGELGAAVVDGGQAHGPQDAVGHRRRAGNLQESDGPWGESQASTWRELLKFRYFLHTKFICQYIKGLQIDLTGAIFCIQNFPMAAEIIEIVPARAA